MNGNDAIYKTRCYKVIERNVPVLNWLWRLDVLLSFFVNQIQIKYLAVWFNEFFIYYERNKLYCETETPFKTSFGT